MMSLQGLKTVQSRPEQNLELDTILEDLDMNKDEVKEIGNTVNAITALKDLKHDLNILKAAVMLPRHSHQCDCNPMGSVNGTCDPVTKKCACFQRYAGRLCNHCKNGLFNFPKMHGLLM